LLSPSRIRSKIRRARLSDVPALMTMMGAFNRGEQIAWRRQRVLPAVRRLLRQPRLGCILVADGGDADGLRGYAVATFGYDLEFAGRDAFLTELFVRPRHRGTGEGRRLLEAAVRKMRDGGAGAIHLGVWPANRTALRLYGQAGFVETSRLLLSKRLGLSSKKP
jgi:ribosomal protein S18 acetylase RimI-like enzyme